MAHNSRLTIRADSTHRAARAWQSDEKGKTNMIYSQLLFLRLFRENVCMARRLNCSARLKARKGDSRGTSCDPNISHTHSENALKYFCFLCFSRQICTSMERYSDEKEHLESHGDPEGAVTLWQQTSHYISCTTHAVKPNYLWRKFCPKISCGAEEVWNRRSF